MTTWIDVADSTVKIGLGALLGGVFTLITSHVSHRREGNKALRAATRQILEKVTHEVESILFAVRIAFVDEARFIDDSLQGEGYDEEKAWERINKLETQLVEWRAKLSAAEGSLLLYGCVSSTATIKTISECLEKVPDQISPYAILYEKKNYPSKNYIESTTKIIDTLRKEFYETLFREMKNV